MESVFKLSKRKGSNKWQLRKRWPRDVAAILPGEFTISTGEEDKALAQERLPLLAGEYERQVREARDRLAARPRTELSEPEAHRMAVQFFRATLPSYIVRRPVGQLAQRDLLADTRQRLATLREMLGRNEYHPVVGIARGMVQRAGLAVPDEAPSLDHLHRMLMRAFVELHHAAVEHLSGNPDYTPSDSAMFEAPVVESGEAAGKTLESLLEAYEAEKAPSWSPSSKKAIAPVFRLLRDVFVGRLVADVTRDDARSVVKLLEGLPANLGKRKELVGLTVPQAVEKAGALGLPLIQPKTINDGYLIHIAAVFNWAQREQWIASSPFAGLSVHDPVADEDRRAEFEAEQLNTLFKAAPWNEPWDARRDKPGAYWVPLLCLFHGLRNAEAAGLRTEDVGVEDGEPVLRIVAYEGRRLKNSDSRGVLPLHPEMVRMGFLAFVQGRRDAEKPLLFPEAVANSRGQVGAKLSERFSAHVKQAGLVGRKLGMHSFRHNFESRIREAELPQRTALALARRKEPGSSSVYGGGLSIRLKAQAIARITYPGLDLSHLCTLDEEAGTRSGTKTESGMQAGEERG